MAFGCARRAPAPARLALMLALAAALPARAAEPALQYEIRNAQSDQLLATAWGWIEPVPDAPGAVAAVSDTLFSVRTEARTRAVFTTASPPECISWEETVLDSHGVVLSSRHVRWRPEIFPLLTGPFPPATYPLEAPLGYVITHLGFGERHDARFYTVLGGNLARLDLWIDGREQVAVPAGVFDAYRIRMRADAGTLFPKLPAFVRPVLSFFIPTYTLWVSVDRPQVLLKFLGQMGPPGSPQLRVVLVRPRRPS